MNHEELRQFCLREIERFVPQAADDQLGVPLSGEFFAAGLARMKESLLAPYDLEIPIPEDERRTSFAKRSCAIAARIRSGVFLAFDPVAEEFFVVEPTENQFIIHVYGGDAVGCFLAY